MDDQWMIKEIEIWTAAGLCPSAGRSYEESFRKISKSLHKPPGCPPQCWPRDVPETPYMTTTHIKLGDFLPLPLVATIFKFSVGGRGPWECHTKSFIYTYIHYHRLYQSVFAGEGIFRWFAVFGSSSKPDFLQRIKAEAAEPSYRRQPTRRGPRATWKLF